MAGGELQEGRGARWWDIWLAAIRDTKKSLPRRLDAASRTHQGQCQGAMLDAGTLKRGLTAIHHSDAARPINATCDARVCGRVAPARKRNDAPIRVHPQVTVSVSILSPFRSKKRRGAFCPANEWGSAFGDRLVYIKRVDHIFGVEQQKLLYYALSLSPRTPIAWTRA